MPDELLAELLRADATELALELARAYGPHAEVAHGPAALRRYLETKTRLAARFGRFEIVNNRVFRGADALLVPLLVDDVLAMLAVRHGRITFLEPRRYPRGTIFTDRLVLEAAGFDGAAIDLEPELFEFDADRAPEVRTERIRDLVALFERLNASAGRDEAVYLLRFAVARLCSLSFQGFLGAKNLQPEARKLAVELARFLNGPFGMRLRLHLRVLVRNVSGLLLRPQLIDEIWQDTVDLSEVHLRGSSLAGELRRSAHHALGLGTLRLGRGYLAYLETGETGALPADVRHAVTQVDQKARGEERPRELVARVVADLEELLGTSQIATRIEEWMRGYEEALLRCELGSTVPQTLEDLVTRGVRARNRWSYLHHLRVLARKAAAGTWADTAGAALAERVAALRQQPPDAADFDPERAERELRGGVEAFAEELRGRCAAPLFEELRGLLADFVAGDAFIEVFFRLGEARNELETWLTRRDFEEQRYLLVQLDCLLEELGYLCLRHVAAGFEARGLDLTAALRIVQRCAENLEYGGLFSRELWDLGCMLQDEDRTTAEQRDLLKGVQRCYLALVRRVSLPYESLAPVLGLDERGLRAMQANFQRTMHDLNSVAQFADLARAHLRGADASADPATTTLTGGDEPSYDLLHLSHLDKLRRRVESRCLRPNLQDLYGGKGSGLAYLSYLRVPTRDGFVIPTLVGRRGLHRSEPERLERELHAHLEILEEDLARARGEVRRFGDPERPLLLAVRGGSVFSMPGMLSTIVFVGMTDAVAEGLARRDLWHAYDSYRRFLVTWADSAWGIDLESFDLIERAKLRHGARFKSELPGAAMREVVEATKAALRELGHGDELDALLADPRLQIARAVQAVLASWDGERARRYRRIQDLSDRWHTAVVVQEMASGNRRGFEVTPGMDETLASLTGVIPRTQMTPSGFRAFTGDVKFHASGDDLVGGMTAASSFQSVHDLERLMPMLDRQLRHIDAKIRRFRGTDAEVEFTVDRGVLSVLQARMAPVGGSGPTPAFEDAGEPVTHGIGVRGGAFRGRVAFDEADLDELRAEPLPSDTDVDGVVLVLENPTPDQIPLVLSADALVTERGGSTSHTAVAVQSIEDRHYAAVLSAAGLRVDAREKRALLFDEGGAERARIAKGDVLSLHGTSGELFLGARALHRARSPEPPHTPRT